MRWTVLFTATYFYTPLCCASDALGCHSNSLSLSPISYILISVVVSLFLFLLNGRCRRFSAAAPFAAVSYRRNTQQPNGKVGKKKKKKMLLLLLIPPLLTGIPGKGNWMSSRMFAYNRYNGRRARWKGLAKRVTISIWWIDTASFRFASGGGPRV